MRGDARGLVCEATVKVRVGDTVIITVADGDGPVNALDGALRMARTIVSAPPQGAATDFKVRISTGSPEPARQTRY